MDQTSTKDFFKLQFWETALNPRFLEWKKRVFTKKFGKKMIILFTIPQLHSLSFSDDTDQMTVVVEHWQFSNQ